MTSRTKSLALCCMALLLSTLTQAQEHVNGQLWMDTDGQHINAHGGNIIQYNNTYYWYGENRPTAVAARRRASPSIPLPT